MAEENRPISPETFIHERKRGARQAEKDILARAGVQSVEELVALAEQKRQADKAKAAVGAESGTAAGKETAAGKRKPVEADEDGGPARKEGESLKAFEERLKKYEEQQAKILARFESEDKERAAAKAAQEAADKEAEEERAAQKKYDNEVEWFREVAAAAGADPDKKKFGRLLKIWEAELADLTPRAFEKLFGEDVPDEKQAENAKKMLADLQKDHPGLFKPAATSGTEEKKPASTGAAATPPEGSKPASGTREPLDTRKLSVEQYRLYNANPKLFKERFAQGLIEYPGKK
ncbi:MAG: hypothetical protein E6R03_14040 [Hyphomicrobiaceae bacterium]|nr:MAG: hypothetical protein E6R03_14040 [Hyphomicrobiaceae bacterium]